MHAVKIPFTGFFLGGFAIVVITLIAHSSLKPFRAILEATILVLMVKGFASPHSPPMAYLAVSFQGVIGAICFGGIPLNRLAAVLFGGIALLESAIQKFLIMTLLFGKSIWEALDSLVLNMLKDLSIFYHFSTSYWLILSYSGIYVLWGFALGWWASALPKVLHHKSEHLLLQYKTLENIKQTESIRFKGKKHKRYFIWIGIFIACIAVFFIQDELGKVTYLLFRTFFAVVLLFFVLNPFVKWLFNRWMMKNRLNKNNQVNLIMDLLPELKNYVLPAMQLAKQEQKGLLVYKAFIENLLILTLYESSNEV